MARISFGALAAVALAGCVATDGDVGPRGGEDSIFRPGPDGLSVTNRADRAAGEGGEAAGDAGAAHEGPWSWEELAVRAGLRSDEARVAMLEAAGRRLKAERDLAWKEPELRFAYDRANAGGQKDDFLKTPDPLDNGRSHGADSGFSLGVRFYVPNPFVNRYLRHRADATDGRYGAKAAVEAYAVYSEVKMLCCEAVRAGRELAILDRQTRIYEELSKVCEESLSGGVFKSPLDSIRAETKAMKHRVNRDRLQSKLASLKGRIAFLADVPERDLRISESVPELPDADRLSAEELTEVAFARRPDLAEAIFELKAAEADVGVSKAENIPWFRFVEASYNHGNGRENSYGRRSEDYEDGYELKASLYLPVFTWLGSRVTISKTVRDLAGSRVDALRASIRDEVAAAIDDYRSASRWFSRKETDEFVRRMEDRIEEYSKSARASAEDTYRVRDELEDYLKASSYAEMMKLEAALRLESVIGGPCPR